MQRVKIKIAKNRRQWEKGECLLGELHNARLMSFKTAITQHARWLDQRNQNGSTGDPGHLETPFQGPGTGEPNTTQLTTRTKPELHLTLCGFALMSLHGRNYLAGTSTLIRRMRFLCKFGRSRVTLPVP